MGKFSKAGGREMPELNTSSLPDLVFAFLFFIMMVTSMREARIQLNDAFAETSEIQDYIAQEKSSMKEEDQPFMTVSIKADKETKMGTITDIKQALREAYALKISYSAAQRVE